MADKQKAENGTGSKRAHDDNDADEDGYSTSSSYAPSAIDVSFNYVAPSEIDFVALKRLVQQLYHTHAPDLDLGALAEHIIQTGQAPTEDVAAQQQPAVVGTVVKVEDDEDGDPFAFASAIELSGAQSAATKTLRAYYEKQLSTAAAPSAKAIWSTLASTSANFVQLFHERMINMPPQIMPPLYRMLLEEIHAHPTMKAATHFLLFSRVFSTEAFSDDEDDEAQQASSSNMLAPRSSSGAVKKSAKKAKKVAAAVKNQAITTVTGADVAAGGVDANEVGLFHPEDALFAKYALHTHTFRFPSVKDSDDSFNAPMYGRIVLIKNEAKQMQTLLDEMTEAFAVPAPTTGA